MKHVIRKANQFRKYLFSTPTKSIEFLSGLSMTSFGLIFLFNGSILSTHKIYLRFNYIGPIWVWWLAVIIGLIQLNAMRRDTLESNTVSAIFLKVAALMCFLIALMFGSDYPPLSTGVGTYLAMCLVNIIAGFHLSAQNDYEFLMREKYRNE